MQRNFNESLIVKRIYKNSFDFIQKLRFKTVRMCMNKIQKRRY